jgi:arsenate reductase
MAEAFLRRFADERFVVYSAGVDPRGIDPLTTRVMNEVGIDISDQSSKDVKQFLGRIAIDYLVVVCERADACCPRELPNVANRLVWPVVDPPSPGELSERERLAAFRLVRDVIADQMLDWLEPVL